MSSTNNNQGRGRGKTEVRPETIQIDLKSYQKLQDLVVKYEKENIQLVQKVSAAEKNLLQSELALKQILENGNSKSESHGNAKNTNNAYDKEIQGTQNSVSINSVLWKYLQDPTDTNLYLVESSIIKCFPDTSARTIMHKLVERIRKLTEKNNEITANLNATNDSMTTFHNTIKNYFENSKQGWVSKKVASIYITKEVYDNLAIELIADIKNRRTTYNTNKKEVENEKTALENQIHNLQQKVQNAQETINQLRNSLEAKDQNISFQTKDLEQKSKEWKKQSEEHQSQINSFKHSLSLKERQINELQADNYNHKVELDERANKINEQYNYLKQQNTQHNEEKSSFAKTKSNLTQKISDMEIQHAKILQQHEKVVNDKTAFISKKEKELVKANDRINQLLQLKRNLLQLQRNSTIKYERGLNTFTNFTNTIVSYTKCVSLEQFKENAVYNSVKIKKDRISQIRQKVETEITNISQNEQGKLHLKEVLIRALEDLDRVLSNGNQEIQRDRVNAIVHVKQLYQRFIG